MQWPEFISLYSFISKDFIKLISSIDLIIWGETIFQYLHEIIMRFIIDMRSYSASHIQGIIYFSYVVLGFGIFSNVVYFIQIPLAAIELLRTRLRSTEEHTWWLLTSDITIPISIVIPAYNEEVMIVETVTSALATQYPSFELIIVNDGSSDSTLEALITEFDLTKSKRFYESKLGDHHIRGVYGSSIYSNLVVVDKENGGRSSALNAGIDIARNPLFCSLDADSCLDPSALLKTVQPFIDYPDKMVATGGTVRIMNGCDVEYGIVNKVALPNKLLPLFQVVEYMRAFLMGRLAWSHLGIVTLISGAFAIFKRDYVIKVGGFRKETIGEDFELVMKLHKYCLSNKIEYDMKFVPEPVCWTEVPENIEVLSSQIIRWQQGGLEVFFRHRSMLFNPRYGKIGMLAYPFILILDVLSPIAELLGYILLPVFYFLNAIDFKFMIAFLCLFFVLGIFISTMSLILEEISVKRFSSAKDLLKLGFAAIIENFGYRQYNNVWRIIGWWRFLRKKQEWGNMKRVGAKKKG